MTDHPRDSGPLLPTPATTAEVEMRFTMLVPSPSEFFDCHEVNPSVPADVERAVWDETESWWYGIGCRIVSGEVQVKEIRARHAEDDV
jgi:hypothetical protein